MTKRRRTDPFSLKRTRNVWWRNRAPASGATRAELIERVCAMAGIAPDGAILPPQSFIVTDRTPKSWWRNQCVGV